MEIYRFRGNIDRVLVRYHTSGASTSDTYFVLTDTVGIAFCASGRVLRRDKATRTTSLFNTGPCFLCGSAHTCFFMRG